MAEGSAASNMMGLEKPASSFGRERVVLADPCGHEPVGEAGEDVGGPRERDRAHPYRAGLQLLGVEDPHLLLGAPDVDVVVATPSAAR
jgi:hypothetical protein